MLEPEIISINDLYDISCEGNFEVCKIKEIKLDPVKLNNALDLALSNYKLIEKDGYEKYKSICLQYREGTTDPLYDDVGQKLGTVVNGEIPIVPPPKGWCYHKTEIGKLFDFIWEPLEDYIFLLRGRIMQALPQFKMEWHNDGKDNRRIHIPIQTNEHCLFEYKNGHSYHMPADGSVYIVNATNDHRAVNYSNQSRTHLTFSFLVIPDDYR